MSTLPTPHRPVGPARLFRRGAFLRITSSPLALAPARRAQLATLHTPLLTHPGQRRDDPSPAAALPAATRGLAGPCFTTRRELPARRENNVLQKLTIIDGKGRHTLQITVGFYPDSGTPAEIFVILSKTGSGDRAFLDALARAVSLGLQHGVPLASWVDMFIGTQNPPAGTVIGHPNIKRCQGPIDLLFRWLGFEFCGMKELGQVQTPAPDPSED